MSKALATTKVETPDVISSEQAHVIEVAQKYSAGFKASVTHTKGYALLFGTALNQLKEITPHGGFIALQEKMFPEYGRAWLNRLMQFAEAKKLKCLVTGHLKNGQLLLALDDKAREELFENVEEITGDKSIEQIALEVAKKKTKDKHKDDAPPSPADESKRKAENAIKTVKELRRTMALLVKTKALLLLPDDEMEQLEEDRITFGRHIAEITKHRKPTKK